MKGYKVVLSCQYDSHGQLRSPRISQYRTEFRLHVLERLVLQEMCCLFTDGNSGWLCVCPDCGQIETNTPQDLVQTGIFCYTICIIMLSCHLGDVWLVTQCFDVSDGFLMMSTLGWKSWCSSVIIASVWMVTMCKYSTYVYVCNYVIKYFSTL